MIIHDSQGRPIYINPYSHDFQSWQQIAQENNSIRIVIRNENVYGRKYTFYDIYNDDKLIAIE